MATILDNLKNIIPFSESVPESFFRGVLTTEQNYNWAAAAFLSWIAQEDAERQSKYKTYRAYYDGDHIYQLTERMKEFLELDPNVSFDLNYLPLTIDVLAERMNVLGFTGSDGIGGNDGILYKWWTSAGLDATQHDVHLTSFRDGDSYLLVGWDSELGRPTFDSEVAYDGDNGVHVRYWTDNTSKIRLAFKRWQVTSGADTWERLNVYTDSAIYKFKTGKSGGWEAYIAKGENWPTDWTDKNGNPLGVSVVHYKNKGAGWIFGKSELADLVPVQDALNKAVLDEIGGADVEGFGLITLSGGRPPINLEIGPRKVLYSPDGTWGQIDAGNLVALSDLVHNYIVRLAQISRTPLQYFQSTKQIASGETQQAYDTGLISKAEHRAMFFGRAWVQAMQIAMRLSNAFGDTNFSQEQMDDLKAVWGTFERVDRLDTEKKRSDIVARLVEAGSSLNGALIVAGYSQEERDKILEGAPLVAPIFLKAGGVGRAEASLLGKEAQAKDMTPADKGGDIAPVPARAE